MTLQLTTFEQAKMLKEAGFDWLVNDYISVNDDIETNARRSETHNFNDYYNCYSQPSLHLAAQWLREVKGIHVYVDASEDWEAWYPAIIIKGRIHNNGEGQYRTHNEALSAGITQALTIKR